MICRVWRGRTTKEKADAFAHLAQLNMKDLPRQTSGSGHVP